MSEVRDTYEIRSCEAAAVEHHCQEVVQNRLAIGVVSLAGLGGAAVMHRRRKGSLGRSPRLLPPAFVPTVGATVFGAAAALLFLDGANLLAQGLPHGAGGQLSGALVSAAIAAWFTRTRGGSSSSWPGGGWRQCRVSRASIGR